MLPCSKRSSWSRIKPKSGVERSALPDGFAFGGDLFPAHDLGRYTETAGMADAHDDERLRAAIAEFEAFGASSGEREATTFRATRVDR